MPAPDDRWNHNIHYHRLVVDAIEPGTASALDVGCGNGLLSAELAARIPDVTGIDLDADVLAGAQGEAPGVTWVCADVMTHGFGRRFDVVASVATLHHLPDLHASLARFADLTAPGGQIAVIGLARSTSLVDYACDLAGVVAHRWHRRQTRLLGALGANDRPCAQLRGRATRSHSSPPRVPVATTTDVALCAHVAQAPLTPPGGCSLRPT